MLGQACAAANRTAPRARATVDVGSGAHLPLAQVATVCRLFVRAVRRERRVVNLFSLIVVLDEAAGVPFVPRRTSKRHAELLGLVVRSGTV